MSATWEQYLQEMAYSQWCHENSGHVDYICTGFHTQDQSSCMFCDGGLSACIRCNAFEGATPSECPGEPMSPELADQVYHGIVDYRFGGWRSGCTVVMMHGWLNPPEPGDGWTIDWPKVEAYLEDHPYVG